MTLASSPNNETGADSRRRIPHWRPRTPVAWQRVALVGVALLAVALGILGRALSGTQQVSALMGHAAPDFSLTSEARGQLLPGETSLASSHGSPRLLVFFYTLCTHCLTELATVAHVQESLAQDGAAPAEHFVPLFIDSPAESPAIADAYVMRVGISAPVLLDSGARVAARYGIAYYPTLVLVDGAGVVRATWTGEASAATVTSAIRQAG
ncbi:MAG TPA: TlpA disulfide reductase family protein [Ktedonobacterales bacterium]